MRFDHTTQQHFTFENRRLVFSIILMLALIVSGVLVVRDNKKESSNAPTNFVSLSIPGCTMGMFDWTSNTSPQVIKLNVDFDDLYYWDKEQITLQELRKRLAALSKETKPFLLQIDTNSLATFGAFVTLLSSVREADIDFVFIESKWL
ncbi:MAG: hypothetical protein HY253_10590 [Burkholderiales bacterium]|nr:hypothetical protein [Burkholderiales bacterium]